MMSSKKYTITTTALILFCVSVALALSWWPSISAGQVKEAVLLTWNRLGGGYTYILDVKPVDGTWIRGCVGSEVLKSKTSYSYEGVCESQDYQEVMPDKIEKFRVCGVDDSYKNICTVIENSWPKTSQVIILDDEISFESVREGVIDRTTATTKSATWRRTFSNLNLLYNSADNSLRGWLRGLSKPDVTIKYYARVINVNTRTQLPDKAAIPVGTLLRFDDLPLRDRDIYWFGTGHFSDSPYGHWVPKAAQPSEACKSMDFFKSVYANILRGHVGIFIALNVDPPKKPVRIDLSESTAKLEKVFKSDNLYIVTKPGKVNAKFIFPPTYGKFYLDWKDGGVCRDLKTAMRRSGNLSAAYVMTVPEQTIEFNLKAVDVSDNVPPNPPMINESYEGTTEAKEGENETFTFLADDPDEDNIRYLIDWDMDGTVDDIRPTTAGANIHARKYIASRMSLNSSFTWNTFGEYTFRARTEDENGLLSKWTTHTVKISDGGLSVSCSANPDPIIEGEAVTWSASATGGSGSYAYTWSGNGVAAGTTGEEIEITYANTGSTNRKGVSVNVFDGVSTKIGSCLVDISEASPVQSYTPSESTVQPTIEVSPRLVRPGDITTVSWNTNGNTDCTVSENLGVDLDPYEINSVDVPVTAKTTFTINCGIPVSATVNVLSSYEEN